MFSDNGGYRDPLPSWSTITQAVQWGIWLGSIAGLILVFVLKFVILLLIAVILGTKDGVVSAVRSFFGLWKSCSGENRS